LAQAALDNSYLAAALLKLEHTRPFLPIKDKAFFLSRMTVSPYFPGPLINFWRVQLYIQSGSDYSQLKENLLVQLNGDQPCDALLLIMACISEQLIADKVVEEDNCVYRLNELAGINKRIMERLAYFPVISDKQLGHLNPLRFNYI